MLYLDNAATSRRKPVGVYASMIRNTLFGSQNAGRGGHKLSMAGVRTILDTQDAAAELFKIKNPQNITFMQNATYALNTAIRGVLRAGDHVIATAMDHNSVLRPVHEWDDYTIVDADGEGFVNPADVENAVKENTRLIICTHASNVCGTLQAVEEIGEIAKRHGALFLLDTAQTAGCVDIDTQKINVDFLAFSGHKGLMGPLGTGGLYVKNPKTIRPIVTGGTGSNSIRQPDFMPDMLHSGTMNTPAIAALGEGIRYILRRGAAGIGEHENYLADFFESELMNMRGVRVYGRKPKIGITAFNIDGMDSVYTAQLLGDKFALRAGYHCAPLAHRALGTSDVGAVRASFGAFSKKRDAKRLADAVYRIVKTSSSGASI